MSKPRRAFPSKPRNILNAQQASVIFQLGIMRKDKQAVAGLESVSSISKAFGISPKAVRDIWNERTWHHATARIAGNDPISHQTPQDFEINSKQTSTSYASVFERGSDKFQSKSQQDIELPLYDDAQCPANNPSQCSMEHTIDWVLGQWDQGRLELQFLPDPFEFQRFDQISSSLCL